MQLRSLRAFVEVVRHGGFSQAARVVHTTQSTVSKAVQALAALNQLRVAGYADADADADAANDSGRD